MSISPGFTTEEIREFVNEVQVSTCPPSQRPQTRRNDSSQPDNARLGLLRTEAARVAADRLTTDLRQRKVYHLNSRALSTPTARCTR